eukprot:TRINITY_DN6778_c0_g1_i1.p1 TRINITY_DN6778_c0_g1~~TRINITY_DN6778_c0_g1_i1.p1  ORF type:complete len:529 (+),score=87.40 TRINITY_DN6778_c0_g1_i1:289-1875(+)
MKKPLSVELGPGLLGSFFDGLQRPFEDIKNVSGSIHIPRGINLPALDRAKQWCFQPEKIKVGDVMTGGDFYGKVQETFLLTHWLVIPPTVMGKVTYIAPAGYYTITEVILEIEFEGKKKGITMLQEWPVRKPRPINDRLPLTDVLITGIRVMDVMFPCAQGGTATYPCAFATSCVTFSIPKFSNSDVYIHASSGDRANDVAEDMLDFPQLTIMANGVRRPIMEKMCMVCNTSDMPLMAREASIYTGVAIAEYYRDMGYNVSIVIDNLSRWAEAMKEIARRVESQTTSIASRFQNLFSRAGKVTCLGTPMRTASLTMVAGVSPPGGDFCDEVTNAVLNEVQCFWAIDRKLAQKRPCINWLLSFSKCWEILKPYYEAIDPDLPHLIHQASQILEDEDQLLDVVAIVGNEGLAEEDKVAMATASALREEFLLQHQISAYDRFCPIWKAGWMLKNIMRYHEHSLRAVRHGLSMKVIAEDLGDLRYRLAGLKFQDVESQGEAIVRAHMQQFWNDIAPTFDLAIEKQQKYGSGK